MGDINSRTVDGLLSFSDYLKEKHFLGANTVEGWKTAIKKVFEGVDGEAAGSVETDGLDLDAYLRRFQVAEGRNYKPDTIAVYGRRIRQAIEAQRHYVDTGQVPSFKTAGVKAAPAKPQTKAKPSPVAAVAASPADDTAANATGQLVKFPFPLRSGVMAEVYLPARGIDPKDTDRLCAFIRALQFEEQRQLPRGEDEELAA